MPALANTFLFVEPLDNSLDYGSLVLQQIVKANRQAGQTILEIAGDQATPENVKAKMQAISPSCFCGIGHGNECYDEETEILTENGWKRFSQLEANEKVACLNPKTDELEYEVPSARHRFRYKGKMLRIAGKRISLLVTPNHELYVRRMGRQNGKLGLLPYQFLRAENIGKKGAVLDNRGRLHSTGNTMGYYLKFKQRAKWNCSQIEAFQIPEVVKERILSHGGHKSQYFEYEPSKKVKIQDWLRFFGIWLAEGSASLGQRKGEYIISITQNDDQKRKIIKEWVDRIAKIVGFSAWEEQSNEHSKAIKFKNKQLYQYLKQFGHSKDKFIPKEIKMLPPKDLRILLDAMVLGDGYVNAHAINYATSSKRLADDVQEIALKLGKVAIISRDMRTGVFLPRITNSDAGVTKKSMKWIDYDGEVYCVTVPNHLIYVRRNSRACWCGNSTYTVSNMAVFLNTTSPNLQLFQGVVADLCSCLTAVSLGPAIIDAGAVTYTGYKTEFWFFVGDPAGTTRPVQSPFLAEFQFVASLLHGKSTGDARKDQMAKFDEEIVYWTTGAGKDDSNSMELARILEMNKANSVFLGEGYVTPSPSSGAVITAGASSIPFALAAILLGVLIYREIAK